MKHFVTSNEQFAPNTPIAVVGARGAAKLLGVGRSTLYRQLHEMPPRVRLSARRFGWRVSDLMQWLETRREAT